MPEAFKHNFDHKVIRHLAQQLSKQAGLLGEVFHADKFVKDACNNLDELELKARSNQIATALATHLPTDFIRSAKLIDASLVPINANYSDETMTFTHESDGLAGWIIMPVADYITTVILQHPEQNFDHGIQLLKRCTCLFSAEFAIRPLLRDLPSKTLATLLTWQSDKNVHVRRLVSEGTRPYLPWGIRLHQFVAEPELIIPFLEALKDDDSEYVRRSVANNLNDIAKDHPNKVAALAQQWWLPKNKNRTRLIKHACRTLIKQGHPKVLEMLGYFPVTLAASALTLSHKQLAIGESQQMTLTLKGNNACNQALLIDYVVHHQKANKLTSKKVFKWTSIMLGKGKDAVVIQKAHSFKKVTTRKYYSGEHKIEVLINGQSVAMQSFLLT